MRVRFFAPQEGSYYNARIHRLPGHKRTFMQAPVQVGIVGLGRWARVLTRAAAQSEKLKIVAAHSRTEDKRNDFRSEFGVPTVSDLGAMLADPVIRGVILTVPNEQHWPLSQRVAQAKKHVYTEKPIANTLEDGLRIAALERVGDGFFRIDRKSTRLNSSHDQISYAVFCLKKK